MTEVIQYLFFWPFERVPYIEPEIELLILVLLTHTKRSMFFHDSKTQKPTLFLHPGIWEPSFIQDPC